MPIIWVLGKMPEVIEYFTQLGIDASITEKEIEGIIYKRSPEITPKEQKLPCLGSTDPGPDRFFETAATSLGIEDKIIIINKEGLTSKEEINLLMQGNPLVIKYKELHGKTHSTKGIKGLTISKAAHKTTECCFFTIMRRIGELLPSLEDSKQMPTQKLPRTENEMNAHRAALKEIYAGRIMALGRRAPAPTLPEPTAP